MFDCFLSQSKIGNIVFLILFTAALFFSGCNGEQRLTRAQWLERMPSDPNRAAAQVVYEEGILVARQKAKDLAAKHSLERLLFVIFIASIAGLIILVYLKLRAFSFLTVAVMAACAAGIGLLQMDEHYPKLIPLVGGAGMLIFGGAAAYYLIAKMKLFRGLKDVVQGSENFKKRLPDFVQNNLILKSLTTDEIANKIIEEFNDSQRVLQNQSPVTKSLVAGIRKKINGNK